MRWTTLGLAIAAIGCGDGLVTGTIDDPEETTEVSATVARLVGDLELAPGQAEAIEAAIGELTPDRNPFFRLQAAAALSDILEDRQVAELVEAARARRAEMREIFRAARERAGAPAARRSERGEEIRARAAERRSGPVERRRDSDGARELVNGWIEALGLTEAQIARFRELRTERVRAREILTERQRRILEIAGALGSRREFGADAGRERRPLRRRPG